MAAYENLSHTADLKLKLVLNCHETAKTEWLETEIKPLLLAGYLDEETTKERLNVYAARFPSFEKIQRKFGVQLKGPVKLQSFREALEADAAARIAFARARQAEADAAQARALQEQSLAVESEARQKAWAAQQEALLKTRAAEAKANAEALAYARAYSYQEQQIKSAIEEKANELRNQVLGLLYKKLQKISQKDYQPGKLPPGLKKDLESLVESATILSQTDQSLGDVIASLEQVKSTGSSRNNNSEDLRSQVTSLLESLETRLTLPDYEAFEDDGHLERSLWVNFTDTPIDQIFSLPSAI